MYFRNIFKKKFVRDSIWSLMGVGILAISGVLINILIGNFLDVSSLGIFNYVYALYIVLSSLAVFGLTNSVIKHTSESADNQKELNNIYTSAILLVSVISSLSLSVILLFSEQFFSKSVVETHLIRTVLVAIPLYSINQVLLASLNGLRKMREYAILRSFRWFLIFSFVLISIYFKNGIDFVLLSFISSEVIMLFILLVVTGKYYNFCKPFYTKFWIKTHLDFGLKTTLTQAVNQLDNKLSLLLMGFLLSKSDIGVFSFAFTMANGLLMVPMAISINFNPLIANMWKTKREMLVLYIKKIKSATFILVLLMSALSLLLYPMFISVFMREDSLYMQTVPIFTILMLGNIVFGSMKGIVGFLPMIGEPEKHLKIKLVSFTINVILSLTLIKYYGLYGAAVATALANIFFTGLLSFAISKKLKLR